MAAHTSMIHVRVDDRIKSRAADALAGVGPTLSDAVRILPTRVAAVTVLRVLHVARQWPPTEV